MEYAIPLKAVKMLRRVKNHILREPKRLNMRRFAYNSIRGRMSPSCGTVGCIAGWTCLLDYVDKHGKLPEKSVDSLEGYWNYFGKACRVLGMRDSRLSDLFYRYPYIRGLKHGTKPYAKAVASRIEKFIKTGK